MLLNPKFQMFVEQSPVSVMVRGTLERVLHPDALQQLFDEHAILQYSRKITFAQCVSIMDDVVFEIEPSPGAWFVKHGEELGTSRQAMYAKLRNIEPHVSAALLHYAGSELMECVSRLPRAPKAPLPGYRSRVLDGNHLTGTEHRLAGLRGTRAAALPGQALVFYDLRYDLITEVIPCEDAYTQERALLDQALAKIAANDCIIADRNFCTTAFLVGIQRKSGGFVIREHGSNVAWQPAGPARKAGKDGQRRQLKEQDIVVTDPITGEKMAARRITIPLRKANDKGEKALYVLTNLPAHKATARQVADLYAERWTIECAFQQMTDDLRTEIDTLAYPKAALFGFCLACVGYNIVALVKAALRSTLGAKFVTDKLSMYYLTLEVAQVTPGMEIAIGDGWQIFRSMSQQEFLATVITLATNVRPEKYTKHKRGPKKPPPKKKSGKRCKHVSTARILASVC
jgi:IS4 transposase